MGNGRLKMDAPRRNNRTLFGVGKEHKNLNSERGQEDPLILQLDKAVAGSVLNKGITQCSGSANICKDSLFLTNIYCLCGARGAFKWGWLEQTESVS